MRARFSSIAIPHTGLPDEGATMPPSAPWKPETVPRYEGTTGESTGVSVDVTGDVANVPWTVGVTSVGVSVCVVGTDPEGSRKPIWPIWSE